MSAADAEPAQPQQQQAPSYLQQGANLVAAGASGAYNVAANTYAALPAVLPSTRAAQAEETQQQLDAQQPQQATQDGESAASGADCGRDARSAKEQRIHETEQSGPSDPARLNKSQQELGTEYDVPTSAGVGTTLSADARALDAARAAKGNGAAAHVPEDYTAEPTPGDEDHACAMMAGDKASRSSSGGATSASASAASDATAPTSTEEQLSGGAVQKHKVGLGAKLKGATIVAAGKLTRNEEKVQHGKAVKHGEE